jgi:hypothetical protein
MELSYCTADNVLVSTMSGTGIEGCILHVSTRDTARPLEGNDRNFATREEATTFCKVMGYLEPYAHVRDENGRYLRLQKIED